jgi:hypothetical protein
MVRSEGNMSLKNPVTPPGIDPGTVRLVAQRLDHYASPGPRYQYTNTIIRLLLQMKQHIARMGRHALSAHHLYTHDCPYTCPILTSPEYY